MALKLWPPVSPWLSRSRLVGFMLRCLDFLWSANFHRKCILGHLVSSLAGAQLEPSCFWDEYPAHRQLSFLKKLMYMYSVSNIWYFQQPSLDFFMKACYSWSTFQRPKSVHRKSLLIFCGKNVFEVLEP